MSLTASSTSTAIGSIPFATDGPFTIFGWFNGSVAQFRRYLSLINTGNAFAYYMLGTDDASASGKAAAVSFESSTVAAQALGSVLSGWNFIAATFSSQGQPGVVVNTSTRVVSAGSGINPTGINQTLVGRSSSGLGGQFAHLGGMTRILNDLEFTYLGGGGNPQWLNYARYWKCAATETATITDYSGTETLTCTGITAGTTDPTAVAPYWTAAALGNQSYTQGTPVGSIDWTTKFDKVAASVDYTVSLIQRSAPGTPSTATGAATTPSNLITLADASGFAVNGYASVTNNSTPVLILAKSGNTLLLGAFQTWANADSVYPFTVSAKTFSFYTSGNTFSGTPAGGDVGTVTVIPRAVNNTTSTLIADGPAYQITIASSGAAPSFSAGPTLTSANVDGYTFGATCNQTATWHLGVYLKGSSTPSVANVKAGTGTGFVLHVTVALTAVTPGSLSATTLTNPKYDVYHLVSNGSGDSALSSSLALQKLPPAGKQYFPITVPTISAITKASSAQITANGHGRTSGDLVEVSFVGGMVEINSTALPCTVINANAITLPIDSTGFTTYTSGGVVTWGRSMFTGGSVQPATNDTGVCDLVTTEDGVPITPGADGSVGLLMGSVSRRQSWTVDFYDDSGQALVGSHKQYFLNVPPVVPASTGIPPPVILPANQTIPSTNIVTGLATDVQGDNLTVSVDVTPPGISISTPNATGTTGAATILLANGTYTDDAGESATGQFAWVVGAVNPPNFTTLAQAQIDQLTASLYVGATYGQKDDVAPAGTAIAQNPPFGTPVQPGSTINVTLSTGIAPPDTPPPTPATSVTLSDQLQMEEDLGRLNQFPVVEAYAVCAFGAGDASGTLYRFFRIPSGARIMELMVQNDPNPTGSQYQCGLLVSPAGAPVVTGSDSILFPATSFDNSRTTWTNLFQPAIARQSPSVANVGLRVWELLGLPADPSQSTLTDVLYDVAITAVTPGTLGGAVALRCRYLPAPPRGLATAPESPW